MSETAFTFLMRVRYAECDMQRVVFNSRYVEYVDVAATEFMRRLLDGDFEALENQVVNANVNWRASARFDDVLAIQVSAQRIGNTSYTLAYTFHNYASGEHLVDATLTYVVVDPDSWQKTAIPEDYRARLQAGLPGVVVDHAGASVMPSS